MATPLLATAKIVMPYTTAGLTHRPAAYVRGLTLVGGTWMINSRTLDANDTDWADAAQGMWDSISYMLDDGIASPTAELWEKSGVSWVLRDLATMTGTNGSGATIGGWATILTLKDTQFHVLRVEVLDINQDVLAKADTLAGTGGVYNSFSKQYTPSSTVTTPPYSWQVGRGDEYIESAGFVSLIAAPNRHLRKLRGLA